MRTWCSHPREPVHRWFYYTGMVPGTQASSEPGCSRDQKQPCADDGGPDGSRDALTGRCETFHSNGARHDRHRTKVHDPDDQEDRHEASTALATVESKAQA